MELKPCPFCGGEAKLERVTEVGHYQVRCVNCPNSFGRHWFYTKKEAVEGWNRRINDG